MFKSARVKLTFWYLLIITIISIFFSIVIYQVLTSELNRIEEIQNTRLERGFSEMFVVPPSDPQNDIPRRMYLDPILIDETKDRIKFILLIINLIILGGSTAFGYFLAEKTLKPIELMVDDQKRFISDASHEFRTPLTSIKTEIEVALRDKKLSLSDAKNLLKSNIEEVDKIQRLSNHLLSLSKYQDNYYSASKTKLNLAKLVEKAVINIDSIAKSRKINITKTLDDVFIVGNENSLVELLNILLDNAVKYSYIKGKVEVVVKKDGKKAILEVKDYGVGIKTSEIPYIFNRFYRADISRAKDKIDGYGLGLSIAENIVKKHKGKIIVKSTLGKGTRMMVYFSVFSQV